MANGTGTAEAPSRSVLVELTSEIVAAYVGHNHVQSGDVPELLATVHAALADLGRPPETEAVPVKPVPIRKTITDEHIISLEDGRPYQTLKKHLTKCGLTRKATVRRGACLRTVPWGCRDTPGRAPRWPKRSVSAACVGKVRDDRKPDARPGCSDPLISVATPILADLQRVELAFPAMAMLHVLDHGADPIHPRVRHALSLLVATVDASMAGLTRMHERRLPSRSDRVLRAILSPLVRARDPVDIVGLVV